MLTRNCKRKLKIGFRFPDIRLSLVQCDCADYALEFGLVPSLPVILLGAIVATSGVFSAFLVNNAICLVLAPLVLELTLALGRQPVPMLSVEDRATKQSRIFGTSFWIASLSSQ